MREKEKKLIFIVFTYLHLFQRIDAYFNYTNLKCCFDYDYVAAGIASGCDTPIGDKSKGAELKLLNFILKINLHFFLLL